MSAREKVVFHVVANVRSMASEHSSLTPKICSRSDVNPLCLLQKHSAKSERFYGEIKKWPHIKVF